MYYDKLIMRLGELCTLIDVLSDIETDNIFVGKDKDDLNEVTLNLIDLYINSNVLAFGRPDFMESLTEDIHSMLALQFENIYPNQKS